MQGAFPVEIILISHNLIHWRMMNEDRTRRVFLSFNTDIYNVPLVGNVRRSLLNPLQLLCFWLFK